MSMCRSSVPYDILKVVEDRTHAAVKASEMRSVTLTAHLCPRSYELGSRVPHTSLFGLRLDSMPTAPIDRPRLRTSRDFTFPSSEGGQYFLFLALRHLEFIQGGAQLRSDLVEHSG